MPKQRSKIPCAGTKIQCSQINIKKKKKNNQQLLVVTYWLDVSEKTSAHCLIANMDRALLIRWEQWPKPLGCGFTFLICAPL